LSHLYTKMKIFHYKEKLDSLPQTINQILPPIHIRIKPTNVCNHNCKYCAYKSDSLQLGKDMKVKDSIPKDKMIEIIQDLEEISTKAITFSGGGDPFCYPYLLEIVQIISKTNIEFASLTNGSKLSGEISDIFANNAKWIRISMDGWDDHSYKFYRGVSGKEYTKIMKNIENFKKIGGNCYLGISIIVDNHNSSHIFEMIKRLKNVGVDSVKVSPCIIDNDGEKNNEYHKSIFATVKEQVTQSIEGLSDNNFEIYDSYHELEGKFNKYYNWCPYLQILPVIGADMMIYSCQDKAYNLDSGVIGSIKDKTFKEFWFSDKNNFFSIDPSIKCNHHCVSNEKNTMILEYLNTDEQHKMFV